MLRHFLLHTSTQFLPFQPLPKTNSTPASTYPTPKQHPTPRPEHSCKIKTFRRSESEQHNLHTANQLQPTLPTKHHKQAKALGKAHRNDQRARKGGASKKLEWVVFAFSLSEGRLGAQSANAKAFGCAARKWQKTGKRGEKVEEMEEKKRSGEKGWRNQMGKIGEGRADNMEKNAKRARCQFFGFKWGERNKRNVQKTK